MFDTIKYRKEYYKKNKTKLLAKQKEKRFAENPEKRRHWMRTFNRRRRMEVLLAYGGECLCCGETQYEFLVIDHINGGGNEERKHCYNIYAKLKRLGYPIGYRVLCHNCNASFGAWGRCPHECIQPV